MKKSVLAIIPAVAAICASCTIGFRSNITQNLPVNVGNGNPAVQADKSGSEVVNAEKTTNAEAAVSTAEGTATTSQTNQNKSAESPAGDVAEAEANGEAVKE